MDRKKGHDNMFDSPIIRALVTICKWFPVFFITAIIGWSYYAYIVQLCILEVKSDVEKGFYIFFYHIFFILFIWSYWQCVFTNAGKVPEAFRLKPGQWADIDLALAARDYDSAKMMLENFGRDLPVYMRGYNGDLRYCEKCKIIKPDRAHHCSLCEKCVIKMDHHCPWINNCVCFNNYKFFVLFLGHAMLYCLYVASTNLQYFIKFWRNELSSEMGKFHILFLFFVSAMFFISLCTLFSYHCYLVMTNRTTIESHRPPVFLGGPDKNGFTLGRKGNFREIFGDKALLWFLPVFSGKGDGIAFPITSVRCTATIPVDPQTDIESLGSSLSPKSNGHGHSFPVRTVDEDRDDLLQRSQRPFGGSNGQDNPVVNFSSYASPAVRVENERSLI